eukprot:scaffold2430_cov159-Amphora_coffeaeformis.AAC.11
MGRDRDKLNDTPTNQRPDVNSGCIVRIKSSFDSRKAMETMMHHDANSISSMMGRSIPSNNPSQTIANVGRCFRLLMHKCSVISDEVDPEGILSYYY